jgi:hypothetical protein
VFLKDRHHHRFKVGKRVVEGEDYGPRGELTVGMPTSKIKSGNGLVASGDE